MKPPTIGVPNRLTRLLLADSERTSPGRSGEETLPRPGRGRCHQFREALTIGVAGLNRNVVVEVGGRERQRGPVAPVIATPSRSHWNVGVVPVRPDQRQRRSERLTDRQAPDSVIEAAPLLTAVTAAVGAEKTSSSTPCRPRRPPGRANLTRRSGGVKLVPDARDLARSEHGDVLEHAGAGAVSICQK